MTSLARLSPTTARTVRSAQWLWSLALCLVVALVLRGTTAVLHSHDGEATHLHVLVGDADEHHVHHHEHEHELPSPCFAPCDEDQLELSVPHFEAVRLALTMRWTAPALLWGLHCRHQVVREGLMLASTQQRWKPLVDGPPRPAEGGVQALLQSSRALLI